MLRPEYLSKKLTRPIPTKDGGALHTIQEAWEYMADAGGPGTATQVHARNRGVDAISDGTLAFGHSRLQVGF
jgi:hypothetical protein